MGDKSWLSVCPLRRRFSGRCINIRSSDDALRRHAYAVPEPFRLNIRADRAFRGFFVRGPAAVIALIVDLG